LDNCDFVKRCTQGGEGVSFENLLITAQKENNLDFLTSPSTPSKEFAKNLLDPFLNLHLLFDP